MKTMNVYNYRRLVFNKALLECFGRIQESCCEIDPKKEPRMAEMAKRMSDAFYTDRLNLDTCTVDQTKTNLCEAVTFIKDCINISEAIADNKMAVAQDEKMEIPEDQKIELSEEDEALVDKLFDEKAPTLQIDAIRDATVKSLLAEDQKAQEIRDSLSIAQSQVASGTNIEAMEETVSRLNSRGPTSLMNAIMNAVSGSAVKDVNENSAKPVPVGKIMEENAQEIKSRAVMLFSLYEAANKFGVIKMTPADVRLEAQKIYYNK